MSSPVQDEQYAHLDELEVTRIEKQVNDAMAWMNNKMNLQNNQNLTLDPVVKVSEIQAKAKVRKPWPIISYPVEPPMWNRIRFIL